MDSAMTAAAVRSHELRRRLDLSEDDRQDAQQELWVDLLVRKQHFDPRRASANTFTGLVTRNRSTQLTDELVKYWSRFVPFSDLSYPAAANDDGEEGTADDLLEHAAALWAEDADLFADSMVLRDLQAAMAFMNDDQVSLLHLLIETPDLPSAQKASGLSPATFYRRVGDLRMHLRMFGLRDAA